jgi:FkbM family methyltransferase
MEVCGSGPASWVICPDTLRSEAIVYSFGVGDDVTFDLGLIERFGVDIFAFDPTPGAVTWIASRDLPKQFHFIAYGIGDCDGFVDFHKFDGIQFTIGEVTNSGAVARLPVRRLKSIMQTLSHDRVDLIKMNIEGGEYAAIEDILKSELNIAQWLVEFHHWVPSTCSMNPDMRYLTFRTLDEIIPSSGGKARRYR